MTQDADNTKRGSDSHRFRWLVLGCILALPVLLVLTFLMACFLKIPDKMLQSKLEAQREAAHARGEATCLDDFQLKALPDNENAAVAYNNAYTLFKNKMPAGIDFEKSPTWDRYIASKTYEKPRETTKGQEENTPSGPLTQDEEKLVETLVTSNDEAYKAVCDAGMIQACQFADYDDPSVAVKVFSDDTFFSKMDSVRPLARIIALRAVWEARHGNTDAAYEWIMRGFLLANALKTDPAILTGLKRNGVIATVLDSLNTIMCETPWSGRLPDGFEQELEQLKDRRVLARYFEGERFFEDVILTSDFGNVITLLMQHTVYKVNSDFITAIQEPDPVKRKELLEIIDRYTSEDGQLWWFDSHRDKEKTEQNSKGLKQKLQLFYNFHKMMAMIDAPAKFRSIESFDWSEAQVQNARQALALKRYKQAHGQYPDQLQQLVSAEMDTLPRDPFNGEPFHYKKEGKGFLLYSVGPNYVDDGGIFPKTKRRKDGDIVWRVTQ